MRREFAGAARKAQLVAPLGGTSGDLAISCDDLTGWPTGDHPFYIVIDRDKGNEEKILVVERSGDAMLVFTDPFNGRGADDTSITSHNVGAYVEHIFTATDADEANDHVNKNGNVHGVDGDLAGVTAEQTLTNKTIDGDDNTLINIDQSAVKHLTEDLAELQFNIDAVNTALDDAITAINAALALKADIASPTFTGTVTLPASTSIGDVSATEIGFLNGAVSNIQAQLDAIETGGGGGGSLPIGGDTDEVLAKNSSTNGDASWKSLDELGASIAGIPPGGVLGQALIKLSDTDYDTGWGYVAAVVPPDADIIDDSAISAPLGHDGTGTYTDGGATYRWFRFTTPEQAYSIQNTQPVIGKLLVVGPGGAGGGASLSYPGGGGGAGAYYYHDYAFGVGTHRCLVGTGGIAPSTHSTESIFDDIVAYGGGNGGAGNTGGGVSGTSGGSGGGGGANAGGGSSALYGSLDNRTTTSPEAFDANNGAASGGGDGGAGGGANSGAGVSLALDGTTRTYAKGGAGGVNVTTSAPAASTGSGADGEPAGVYGGSGTGRSGANGIVIVRVRIA